MLNVKYAPHSKPTTNIEHDYSMMSLAKMWIDCAEYKEFEIDVSQELLLMCIRAMAVKLNKTHLVVIEYNNKHYTLGKRGRLFTNGEYEIPSLYDDCLDIMLGLV